MKVVVNRDNCIGCGACEALYPELFQIDDEGLSTVVENESIDDAKLTEVIEGCPTSAIAKEDKGTCECPNCDCKKEEE